jgi:hypothetical protein
MPTPQKLIENQLPRKSSHMAIRAERLHTPNTAYLVSRCLRLDRQDRRSLLHMPSASATSRVWTLLRTEICFPLGLCAIRALSHVCRQGLVHRFEREVLGAKEFGKSGVWFSAVVEERCLWGSVLCRYVGF